MLSLIATGQQSPTSYVPIGTDERLHCEFAANLLTRLIMLYILCHICHTSARTCEYYKIGGDEMGRQYLQYLILIVKSTMVHAVCSCGKLCGILLSLLLFLTNPTWEGVVAIPILVSPAQSCRLKHSINSVFPFYYQVYSNECSLCIKALDPPLP